MSEVEPITRHSDTEDLFNEVLNNGVAIFETGICRGDIQDRFQYLLEGEDKSIPFSSLSVLLPEITPVTSKFIGSGVLFNDTASIAEYERGLVSPPHFDLMGELVGVSLLLPLCHQADFSSHAMSGRMLRRAKYGVGDLLVLRQNFMDKPAIMHSASVETVEADVRFNERVLLIVDPIRVK